MNGYSWETVEDSTSNDNTQTPRDLRKMIEDLGKKLKEQSEENLRLRSEVKQGQLTSLFTDAGLPPKAAKLFPKDVEPTADTVKAFIKEYGDLFGAKPEGSTNVNSGESGTGRAFDDRDTVQQSIDPDMLRIIESLRRVSSESGVVTSTANTQALQDIDKVNSEANSLESFIAGLSKLKPSN